MGVVNRDGKLVGGGGSSDTSTSTTSDSDVTKGFAITLDQIKSKKLFGRETDLDFEEDAWEWAAPAPKDRYKMKVFLDPKGLTGYYLDPKHPSEDSVFYSAPLQCKIVSDNADFDGITVFTSVSTRISRGKSISTMAGMLVKAITAAKMPKKRLNDAQVAELFLQLLKREPILEGDVDWRGSYQDAGGDWVNVFRHYEDFPENGEGGREHITEITGKDGRKYEVRAQLWVSQWYAKGEVSKERKKGSGVGTVPGGVPNFIPIPHESNLGNNVAKTLPQQMAMFPPVNATPQPTIQPQQQQQQPSQEDISLVLNLGE